MGQEQFRRIQDFNEYKTGFEADGRFAMREERDHKEWNENMPAGQMPDVKMPTEQRRERVGGAGQEESIEGALEVLRTVRAPQGMEARIVAAVRTREAEVAEARVQPLWSRWCGAFAGGGNFGRRGPLGLRGDFDWSGSLVPVWAGALAVGVVTVGLLVVGGRGRDGGHLANAGGSHANAGGAPNARGGSELGEGKRLSGSLPGSLSGSSSGRMTGAARPGGSEGPARSKNRHVTNSNTYNSAFGTHVTKNVTISRRAGLQSVNTVEDGPRPQEGKVAAVSYPAPTAPLTEQERLLLRVLHRGDPEEWAMLDPVVQARREALEKAEVQSFFEESSKREDGQSPTAPSPTAPSSTAPDSTDGLSKGESK